MSQAGKESRVVARLVEELEEVLQLPRALSFQKPLGMPRQFYIPLEHWLLAARQVTV